MAKREAMINRPRMRPTSSKGVGALDPGLKKPSEILNEVEAEAEAEAR